MSWHEDKLQTAFRNVGAPWYGGPHFKAARISEIIHFGYVGGSCTRTFLVPLDMAPEGLPTIEFGPCRLGKLSKEQLADMVKPAALERHQRTQFDLEMLSGITWLVIEEPIDLQAADERDILNRLDDVRFDDLDKVPLPSSISETLFRRASLAIDYLAPSTAFIERALFTLLLHSWEDFVRWSDRIWRPFWIPWIYVVNYDPFDVPASAPDADTLSWEPLADSDGGWGRPDGTRFKNGVFSDLERRLRKTWELVEETHRSPESASSAFNPLIEHFLLRAYFGEGIDELIMHMTAIDAAIGDREFNKIRPKKKKYDGMTKALSARMCALLCDPNVGPQFCALYDRRSEYIHGRLGAEGEIKIEDLNSARRLARRVAKAVLEYAANHPDRSRDNMLADLDERAP